MLFQCYHCFKHYDYEKQQADEKNEDLERRNRELEKKLSSMMAGEHTKEVQQAEINKEEASGQHEGEQGGNGRGETETQGDANLLKGTLLKLFKPKERNLDQNGTKKDKKKDMEKVKVVIVLKLERDPITNELTMTATAEANAS